MKNESRRKIKYLENFLHPIHNVDLLLNEIDRGFAAQFLFFWKPHPQQDDIIDKSCLSQWWPSPFQFDEEIYQTAEHFMMAQKARLFEDNDAFQKIMAAPTPKEAKRLGKTVKGFDETTWEKNRLDIVLRGNLAKFSQNKELGKYLLNTSDNILVEASPYDQIWGIGLTEDDPRAQNVREWQGLNLLGFALMETRIWIQDLEAG